MPRFHPARGGHPFSDLLRDQRNKKAAVPASHSGTRHVGEGAGQGKSGANPGGVRVSVPASRSIPAPSKHMDGQEHKVPRGHGSMQTRRGLTHPSRVPAKIGESVRLGAHGQPPAHGTMGKDGPVGGMKAKREHRTLPAHEQGKAHPVGKKMRGRRPKFNVGDAHHNHGKPPAARVKELAGYI